MMERQCYYWFNTDEGWAVVYLNADALFFFCGSVLAYELNEVNIARFGPKVTLNPQ